MSSATFSNGKSSLLLKGYLINNEKESLDIAHDAANENDKNDYLTINEKHVQYAEHLIPGVEITLFLILTVLLWIDVGLLQSPSSSFDG